MDLEDEEDEDFDPVNFIRPTQLSLDVVTGGAAEAKLKGWEFLGDELHPRVLLDVSDRDRMDALAHHLQIVESDEWQHCLCVGSLVLEFVALEGVVARMTLHHGTSIRWDGVWGSDATLKDGWGLARWLADQGVGHLLEELQEADKQAEAQTRAFASWTAAMPRSLVPLYERPNPASDTPPLAPLLAALVDSHAHEDDAILALCEWHGTLRGCWTTYYAFESLPENLLNEFGHSRVVKALERAVPSERQLEGGARFLVMHRGPCEISGRVAEMLRAHGIAMGDPEKLGMIQRLLGGV